MKNNKIIIQKIKCGCKHCKENIVNVIEYTKENTSLSNIECPTCHNSNLTLIMNNKMKERYNQAQYPKHINACCEECKLLYYCPKCDFKFGYEVEIHTQNLNDRCKELPIIRTQKIEWYYPKNDEDVISFPYPLLPKEVDIWIDKFYKLDLMDKNYIENYNLIKDKNKNELTREEILTMLTYYIRQDRFISGLLVEGIQEGILEKLTTKLKKDII